MAAERTARRTLLAAFVLAAASPSAAAQIDFEGDRAGNAGVTVERFAVGDIDGDGTPDVVAADKFAATLRILRNGGDADFTPPSVLAIPFVPDSLVLADLDLDGDLDIATNSLNASSVAVLFNSGGTFAAPVSLASLPGAGGIDARDLDLDGDLDLVVATGSNLSVFQNLGNGTFGARVDHGLATTGGRLHVADMNGDGYPDALVTGRFQDLLSVSLNLGNGSFAPAQTYATGFGPRGVTSADFDGDGDIDAAVTNELVPGVVQIFPNVGGGALGAPVGIPTVRQCVALAAQDYDGDGDPDLLVGSWQTNTVFVHENLGALQLTSAAVVASIGANDVRLVDMDGDSDRDILATSTNSLAVVVVRNDSGRFGGQTSVPAGNGPEALVARDFDGDGDLDLAFVEAFAASFSYVQNLGGTFAPAVPYSTTNPAKGLAAGDFDLDGDVDLATVAFSSISGNGTLILFWNAGNGTFSAGPSSSMTGAPQGMVAGDLDGDGDLDLLVHRSTNNQAELFRNTNGTFVPEPRTLTIGDLRLGDVDGDGDLDAVFGSFAGVTVHRNDGTGAFTAGTTWSSSIPFGTRIALGDVDGDGDLDVVYGTAAHVPAEIAVHTNPGNGTFASSVSYSTGGYGRTQPALLDVDGDGDRDIVTGHDATPNVAVLENLGGIFAPAKRFGLVLSGTGLVGGDFDRDGDLDLAVAATQAAAIVVLRNAHTNGTAVCAGDGSGAACPCGNASAPGAGSGCLHSFGLAGTLRGSGSTSLADDDLVLSGTNMPDATVLYFQGTTAAGGGAGVVFGDGLRCAGGMLVRLATRVNVGGASSYPLAGDPAVSHRGMIAAPGVRVYQAWYRNAASFCTSDTFNLTNGWRVTWGP